MLPGGGDTNAFNPNTEETEEGRSPQVPGQSGLEPGLHWETLPRKAETKTTTTTKEVNFQDIFSF